MTKKYTKDPFKHIMHNGETLELYDAMIGHSTQFDEYFDLYTRLMQNDKHPHPRPVTMEWNREELYELFGRITSYWCRAMNELIEEIIHLTKEE